MASNLKQLKSVEHDKIDLFDSEHLNQLLERAKQAQTAINTFSEFLASKYKLNQGDSLKLDGTIVRKEISDK